MAVAFVRRARFIGDDRRLINVTVSTVGFLASISNGDMVYIDPIGAATDAGKCIGFADLVDSGTKAQNQAVAAAGFAGIAQSVGSAAAATIQVAPGGTFSFPCTSGTYNFGDLVGPEGTGASSAVGVSPTTLVGVATQDLAIGKVVTGGVAVTTITVEVFSKTLAPIPAPYGNLSTLITSSHVTVGGNVVGAGSITSSSPTAGIGYATGAGGAVTQATNKATGVTLNKVCGAITLNNAALAAGVEVAFTLTNSAIAANDIVVAQIKSGGTSASYALSVTATAAGSCEITLTNLSAGSLGEALVINFVVIKGVAA